MACHVLFNIVQCGVHVASCSIHVLSKQFQQLFICFYDCHCNAWCVGLHGLNLQRLDCTLDWTFLFSYQLLHLQTVSAPRSFQHLDLSIAPLGPPPLCTMTVMASQAMLYGPPVPALSPAPPCSPCNDCDNVTTTTT